LSAPFPSPSLSPIQTVTPISRLLIEIVPCEGGEGCDVKFKRNDLNARASDHDFELVNQARVAVVVSDSSGRQLARIGAGASARLQTPSTGTHRYFVHAAGSPPPAKPPDQTILNVAANGQA
jgi:hypothetical protein